jgi:LEA14-like dessication related protein
VQIFGSSIFRFLSGVAGSRLAALLRGPLTLFMFATVLWTGAGCSVEKRENLKKCEFEIDGLEIVTLNFSKLDLLVHVSARNPNASDVIVDRLEFELFTGERKVAAGRHHENIIIPAGERKVLKLEVSTTPGQVGSTLFQALLSGGAMDYRVRGTVYLDTVFGEIPYPLDIEGNTAEEPDEP